MTTVSVFRRCGVTELIEFFVTVHFQEFREQKLLLGALRIGAEFVH